MTDATKNFAKVTVSTGYDAAATSIVLSGGNGALLPTVPFNATWWNSTDYGDPSDDPNKEIVRVTNIATDTLTVTRAQEGTSASTHNTGGKTYKMVAGITKLMIDNINNEMFDMTVAQGYDDFFPGSATTSQIGSLGWNMAVTGTGAFSVLVTPDANHPGQNQLSTGTTNASNGYVCLGSIAAGSLPFPRLDNITNWEFYFVFKIPTSVANPTIVRVGLVDTNNGNATTASGNSIVCELVSATSANFLANTYNAGGTSPGGSSLGVAAGTTSWYTVRIRSTTSGVALVSIATDGGAFSSEVTVGTGQTVNQALPTTGMSPIFLVNNSTAGADRKILVDFFAYRFTGLTRPKI